MNDPASKLFTLVLFVWLAFGCATTPPSLKPEQDQRQFKPDIQQLLGTLAQREKAIQSMNIVFDVEYTEGKREERAQLIAIVQKPDHLYLEIAGPLGPLGVLTCNGEILNIWNRKDNRFEQLPANRENLGTLIPLEMEPAHLVSILSVAPRPIEHDGYNLSFDESEKRWRVTFVDQKRHARQDLWFDLPKGDLYRVSYAEKGKVIGRATYLRWKDDQDVRLPQLWKIEIPARDVNMRLIRQDKVILNKDYPPKVFELAPHH